MIKRGVGFEPTKTRSAGECSNRCATRALTKVKNYLFKGIYVLVLYYLVVYIAQLNPSDKF